MCYHKVRSSKMGSDTDVGTVGDSLLRIRGIENVWQIDARIMPVVFSAIVNAVTWAATIIMIAKRGVDCWLLNE